MKFFARLVFASIIAFGLGLASTFPTNAQDLAARHLAKSCGPELIDYCSTVTVGDGRKLACLVLHNDKLSPRCQRSVHVVSLRLEKVLLAMKTVADQCVQDIHAYCSQIVPGQGRIALCLIANRPSLSHQCQAALADVKPPK